MGYKIVYNTYDGNPDNCSPTIDRDDEGTTSWRDCKKSLRQWYLDRAKELRSISEKDYFSEGNRSD